MSAATEARLSATLVALSDPTRRAILRRLARGEARVTDLAAPFAISLNAVSKHIRTLERVGLIHRKRVGRDHVLSFRATPMDAASAWMDTQREIWTGRLQALDALLQSEDDNALSRTKTKKGDVR